MPPAVCMGAVAGAFADGPELDWIQFVVPSSTKPGDTMIAIVGGDSNLIDVDNTVPGAVLWEQLAKLTVANGTILLARRTVLADDPAEVDLHLDADASFSSALSLLVYRGLDTSAALLGASASNIAASTNFSCPARDFTRYSDLYIGIALVTSAAVAVTHPAGTTERQDFSHFAGKQICVFDFLLEATGSTGIKTATTAANQSGIATSLALQGMPAPGFGRSFTFTPMGAIGLPLVGV